MLYDPEIKFLSFLFFLSLREYFCIPQIIKARSGNRGDLVSKRGLPILSGRPGPWISFFSTSAGILRKGNNANSLGCRGIQIGGKDSWP
jgi:hypothetical protein